MLTVRVPNIIIFKSNNWIILTNNADDRLEKKNPLSYFSPDSLINLTYTFPFVTTMELLFRSKRSRFNPIRKHRPSERYDNNVTVVQIQVSRRTWKTRADGRRVGRDASFLIRFSAFYISKTTKTRKYFFTANRKTFVVANRVRTNVIFADSVCDYLLLLCPWRGWGGGGFVTLMAVVRSELRRFISSPFNCRYIVKTGRSVIIVPY